MSLHIRVMTQSKRKRDKDKGNKRINNKSRKNRVSLMKRRNNSRKQKSLRLKYN